MPHKITAAICVAVLGLAVGGCGESKASKEAAYAAAQAKEAKEIAAEAAKTKTEEEQTAREERATAAAEKKAHAREHAEEVKRKREAPAPAPAEPAAEESSGQTVPDEANARLDVAEEELEGAGLHYKVVGGGVFGVVVASHWTVCSTRPGPGASVTSGATVRLIVARAC